MSDEERGRDAREFLRRIRKKNQLGEALESASRPNLAARGAELNAPQETVDALESADLKMSRGEDISRMETEALEAVILPDERPVYHVVGDRYQPPTGGEFTTLADPAVRARIESKLPAIGRVQVSGRRKHSGTGFLVGPDLLLTNRHVADDFVWGIGTQLQFATGLSGSVDLQRWVTPSDGMVLTVVEPVMVHPWWDAALLRVSGVPDGRAHLELMAEPPGAIDDRMVVCVGYPAFDPERNNVEVQNRVFGGVFDVKRLQPGRLDQEDFAIESFGKDVESLTHDCSTLGGNSGSAVVDVETGLVVGLHFAGIYLKQNHSVASWDLVADEKLRAAGVAHEGTPQSPGTWVSVWDTVESPAPAPSAAAGADAAAPAESPAFVARTWFERASDSEIAAAVRESPEQTYALLRAVLSEEETADLIADLREEIEASQTHSEGLWSRTPDPNLPEIILLHGIMGGHLADQGFFRNRIWLDPKEVVRGNLAERLSLGPDGRTDHGDLEIEADGQIQLTYRKPARKWRKAGFIVHPFSFDWRQSVSDGATALHGFIEQRAAQTGGKPFVLVAHSMGGLVASMYASRFPVWAERVQQAVFLGSPMGGSFSVPKAVLGFHDLLSKLAFLSRSDNLPEFRRMASRLPGLIDMLPNADLFESAQPFYQQSGWQGDIIPLQRWLTQSLHLKDTLHASPLLQRTSLLVNLTHGTVDAWNQATGMPGPATGVGDGTVPALSAVVPGLDAYKVDLKHGDLPKDPKAIDAVVRLIKEGETGLEPVTPSDLKGTIAEEASWTESTEADLSGRRDRFERGTMTQEDLDWLGTI